MSEFTDTDLGRFEIALDSLSSDLSPSEGHGVLCGMLCLPTRFDAMRWLQHLAAEAAPDVWPEGDTGVLLNETIHQTHLAMEDETLSFSLPLPEDDVGLADRIELFASWCRGFLAGVGLSGIAEVGALSEDANEFLRDVEKFGKVDSSDADGEADESALMELCEFTRMGVLLLKAEMGAADQPDPTKKSLH